MITIRMNSMEGQYSVYVDGHADYEENGKDIVCAGVSALVQAFIYYCEKLEENGECQLYECTVEPGLVRYGVIGNATVIQPAYDMMRIGLENISKIFPKNVVCGGRNTKSC